MPLNLASILCNSARQYANAPSLLYDGGVVSYDELETMRRKFAHVLRGSGVRPGDRVALMAPNLPQFTVAYFGILSVGGIVVPLNILLVGEEVASRLNASRATGMVLWEGALEAGLEGFANARVCRRLFLIRDSRTGSTREGSLDFDTCIASAPEDPKIAPTAADDTAVIFHTSGTTGRPKGAEITHFNLFSNARWVSEKTTRHPNGEAERWGPGHVVLASLPFSHSFGQTCLQNAPLFHGAAVSLLPRFSAARAFHKICDDGITLSAAVPAMIRSLVDYAKTQTSIPSTLRYCLVGGAPVPVSSIKAFEETFRAEILEGYGLSETSPVVASRTAGAPRKPGSVGEPIAGVQVRIVDDQGRERPRGSAGEIVVRGDPVMKGYFGDPEATSCVMRGDGFHTGDIGYLDADGHLFVVDRKKDMILRNGYSVYPREVEDLLVRHPAVAEAAVIGVPDAACGEEIVAVVVLAPGMTTTEAALIGYCKKRIAAYKYPRKVLFRDTLPKGAKGQVLRRVLRGAAA